jgi:3'-phosphoadenosine 5'-phosphosulfate (PAPS) 3'-phosphatase
MTATRRTDSRVFFTVDPLDGTKAFVRRQSHSAGTTVVLAQEGWVVSHLTHAQR